MNKGLKALKDIRKVFIENEYITNEDLDKFDIIETELKRIDFLERVNKDLSNSNHKLIEERVNKVIEHRIVYEDYNFQSIKKFVACKDCQYYENEKCMNKGDCFWLDLERKLKALEIIKEKRVNVDLFYYSKNLEDYNRNITTNNRLLTQTEFDLLKEVLL